MNKEPWLTLSEYSSRYDVSVSTLRRRIKANECEYLFDDGKYFLKNCALKEHKNTEPGPRVPAAVAPPQNAQPVNDSGALKAASIPLSQIPGEEASPVFATANRLLNELKKAYSQILQEKEEHVLQLRDEVADLKTLVRVLEDENQRLKESIDHSKSIDQWLTTLDQ